ncbi:MAG: Gfo/Idh/MocA family oxidoreductase [Bacteroidales bacterium]|nr:Gfo/Idh/MocA family oxidoreductase [Bacteroidales bacterium]
MTTRRDFIKKGSVGVIGGSALLSFSPRSYARILGANDTLHVAVIGIRGRGGSHISNYAKMKNVRIRYLVDIDENQFKRRLDQVEEIAGYRPKTAWDMRRVFDDKDVDAVSIATPNHWHALATVWAAQAGKHVYVEKPAHHEIWEGQQMVKASDRYNVLIQVGFQNRSFDTTNRAMRFIRDGKLGDIYMARGLCFKPRGDIGVYPDGPMKPGEQFKLNAESSHYEPPYTEGYLKKVHYDMWLGPAPKRPFNRNRFHYNWHWFWDYGNGDTGNQGPHQFDVARWALGEEEMPVRVSSVGGMYIYNSMQETPNVQTTIFQYADGKVLEFGTRGLYTNPEGILLPDLNLTPDGRISEKTKAEPVKIGTIIIGTEGWMQIDAGGNWQTFFGRNNEAGPTSGEKDESYNPMDLTGGGGGGHFGNFINAVRNNDRSMLTCDIKTGYKSTVLPLLANISYRLRRELHINPATETFQKDEEANRMLSREYRKEYKVPKIG